MRKPRFQQIDSAPSSANAIVFFQSIPTQRCTGSSMIECIVFMGLLLPIGFGMVMLGKMIDIKQTTEQVSRYAAWQSTVSSRSLIQSNQSSLINSRFYSSPLTPIVSDVSDQTQAGAAPNRLWGHQGLRSGSELRAPSEVSIESENAVHAGYSFDLSAASVATGIAEQVGSLSDILGGLSGHSWDTGSNGLVRANVDIGLRDNPLLRGGSGQCQSTQSGVCVQSASVIMSDGWSAGSDDLAKQRVQGFMPAMAFQDVTNVVADIGGFLLFPELRKLKNAFGHVDMHVLPRYAER